MDTILGHSHQKSEVMDVKIPLYNILNMFLTGFVFLAGIITLYPVTLIEVVTGEVFIKLSTVPEIVLLLLCLIASSYEIGLILNRAGSVIIEPVLIKTKFLRFSENYSLYAEASKKTPMLNTISREYALSRTSIVEFWYWQYGVHVLENGY